MKRYEGLFILNTTGREEGIKDTVDKISAEITTAGGKVETVQKMDRRPFSRIADRKVTAGFYVNVIFEAPGLVLGALKQKFVLNEEIFRVLFTDAPTTPTPVAALAAK